MSTINKIQTDTITKNNDKSNTLDVTRVLYIVNPRDRRIGYLSNFSPYGFRHDDKIYITVYHYVESQRFAGTPLEDKIIESGSLAEINYLIKPRVYSKRSANGEIVKTYRYGGKDLSVEPREDWKTIRPKIYTIAIRSKFEQNPYLIDRLLDTDGYKLIVPRDPITSRILESLRDLFHKNLTGDIFSSLDSDIPSSELHSKEVVVLKKIFSIAKKIKVLECLKECYVGVIEDSIYNVLPGDNKQRSYVLRSLSKVSHSIVWSDIYSKYPNFERLFREVLKLYSSNNLHSKTLENEKIVFEGTKVRDLLVPISLLLSLYIVWIRHYLSMETIDDLLIRLKNISENDLVILPNYRAYRHVPETIPISLGRADVNSPTFLERHPNYFLLRMDGDRRRQKLLPKFLAMGGVYSEKRGEAKFPYSVWDKVESLVMKNISASQRYELSYRQWLIEVLELYEGIYKVSIDRKTISLSKRRLKRIVQLFDFFMASKTSKKSKGITKRTIENMLESKTAWELCLDTKAKKHLIKILVNASPHLTPIVSARVLDFVSKLSKKDRTKIIGDIIWEVIEFLAKELVVSTETPDKYYLKLYLYFHPPTQRTSVKQYLKNNKYMENSKKDVDAKTGFMESDIPRKVIIYHLHSKDALERKKLLARFLRVKNVENIIDRFIPQMETPTITPNTNEELKELGNLSNVDQAPDQIPDQVHLEYEVNSSDYSRSNISENISITDNVLPNNTDTLDMLDSMISGPGLSTSSLEREIEVDDRQILDEPKNIVRAKGNLLNYKECDWIVVIANASSVSVPFRTLSEKVTKAVYSTYPYSNSYSPDYKQLREVGNALVSQPILVTSEVDLNSLNKTTIIAESIPEHRYVITLVAELLSGGPKGGELPDTDTLIDRQRWFRESLSSVVKNLSSSTLAIAKESLHPSYEQILGEYPQTTFHLLEGKVRGRKASSRVSNEPNIKVLIDKVTDDNEDKVEEEIDQVEVVTS